MYREEKEREREDPSFPEFITREVPAKEESNLRQYRPSNRINDSIFTQFHAWFLSI